MSCQVPLAWFSPFRAWDASESGVSTAASWLVFVAATWFVLYPEQIQAKTQPNRLEATALKTARPADALAAFAPTVSASSSMVASLQDTLNKDTPSEPVDSIEPTSSEEPPSLTPGKEIDGPFFPLPPLETDPQSPGQQPFLLPTQLLPGRDREFELDAESSDFETYRLGPGDAIFVNVRQYPDLSFQATLDLQGNVIVPLEGVTSLSGETLEETQKRIADIYNGFVVDPDVSITLVAQRGVEVTVLGEVVRPGYYPLGAPQILTALLSAGGTTGQADLRNVLVQRPLSDGRVLEDTIDLFTPLQEGRSLPNTALQDGDVIIVDRLDPTELDEYDSTLVSRSTLAQPTIAVRLLNYGAGRGGGAAGNLTQVELPNGSRFVDFLVRANLNPDTNKLKKITLIRFNEEAGQAVTTTLNGNDAFRGDPAENPPLRNNDVIIVNRTLAARVTFFFNTFTQPFRDVLGFLLFFEQLADSAGDLFSP